MVLNPEKKILILIDWYLPGYKAGGPIQSCANLVARLKNDFDMRVVTGDTDLHDTLPYPEIKSDRWNQIPDGTNVFYFSQEKKGYKNIKSLLLKEQFDVLYLNSLFSVVFTLFPLLIARFNKINSKIIVAPRGMLGKGSLGMKPFKKKIFLRLVKAIGLFNKVTWHASTNEEKNEIVAVFGPQAKIIKAINLTAPRIITRVNRTKVSGKVSFFCLARISPVKNIIAIFRYFKKVNPNHIFLLDLYGTIEDESYMNQCLALARDFNNNIEVNFKGPVQNNSIQQMARAYHFMILPTFNENFGHAIVESLIAGCPVMISNCTPWKNLEALKAGWDLPLDNDNLFIDKINHCAEMDQEEYNQWTEGACKLAEKIIDNPDGINENRELFLS